MIGDFVNTGGHMISVGTRVSYVFAPREYGSAFVITFSQSAIDLSALSRKEKGFS